MLAPLVIFAGFAGLALVGLGRENPDDLPSALTGKPAPAVALTALGNGDPFGNSDLRNGEVSLVNFWASWCGPCRVEHPHLQQLSDEGVTIYGVNYKDKPDNALGFLEELGNPYAAKGADVKGRMALDWGLYGVPETYVVDGQGQIVLRFAGPITERVMENTIRPALEEARQ